MYNSSIKGKSVDKRFNNHVEIKGKIFFNDMSKTAFRDEFMNCDVIYSEIAWQYGYSKFNQKANNIPNEYSDYLKNVNRLIETMNVPAFIVCGKPAKKYFKNAKMFPITISTSGTHIEGCTLYVWNSDSDTFPDDTTSLLNELKMLFHKCLDFSCGYGEHLLMFENFVACDINRDCLTYLSLLYEVMSNAEGQT